MEHRIRVGVVVTALVFLGRAAWADVPAQPLVLAPAAEEANAGVVEEQAGIADATPEALEPGADVAMNEGSSVVEATELIAESDEPTPSSYFSMNYTNIFYGPGLSNTSSYQPRDDGKPDTNRPIFMKNFLSATYGFADVWGVTGSIYWWYQPVLGHQLTMQDPFVRVSNSSLVHTDWGLNLYTDARVHFGVTSASRDANMITGFQTFNYLTYTPNNDSSWLIALRASARGNIYGQKGYGTDAEFYLAPEVNYRFNDKLAATLVYEMGASHQTREPMSYITNDGTDLQPGIEWDPTPNLVVNPYLTLLTGGEVTLATTSVGMFLTWSFL